MSSYVEEYSRNCGGFIAPWAAVVPPKPNTLPSRQPSKLQVRMLYRELEPEEGIKTRTLARWKAGVSPAILIFQHWAVEIGSDEYGWYRYELQYFKRGSELRVTRVADEESMERLRYKKVPLAVKKIFKGSTEMSFGQIESIGQRIINRRKRYILGVSDCHNFAIDLIAAIVCSPKPILTGVKVGAAAIRYVAKPIFLAITKVLEWAGVITEPLQKALGWLYPRYPLRDEKTDIDVELDREFLAKLDLEDEVEFRGGG
ncbi:predicted protein [Uncinocarpus reesii 1704]|uniref:PPPDE domain-containing protein n=1 Tax=Uncinocarpus reesii (strain UAMH 1704) TaxID=336963 RepID=C4JWI5_UNCRE|nr:uncharacterized protein UREG_06927 [Uncinocarpus reesii 1704]EEP82062.1 predicted protein [Uncinocarpus reesii 1704]